MVADFGYGILVVALLVSLYSVVAALVGVRTKSAALVESARRAMLLTWPLITLSALALIYLLVNNHFEISFVYEVTSRSMPTYLKITAWWGGQAGSLVFWSWLMSAFASLVTLRKWDRDREFLPWVIVVSSVTMAFFLMMSVVFENPFARMWFAPSGEVINRHEGFADPQKFLGFLQGSLSRLNRTITRAQKPASTTQLAAASTQESRFGLQGYCPVTFVRTGKLISGQDQWSVVHEGIRYRFATAIGQEEFRKNPDRFAPALHGMCAVRRLDYDSQVEGLPTFAVYVNDRLYLCSDQESREKFSKNPIKYAIVESPRDQNTRIARTEIVTPPTSTPSPSPSPGSGTTARALR